MKTILIWSGLWKFALANMAAAAVSYGVAMLLTVGPIGAVVIGFAIGIPTGFIAVQIWSVWRFDW